MKPIPIINSKIYNSVKSPLEFKKIDGLDNIDKVVEVNQQQIGELLEVTLLHILEFTVK